MKRKFLKLSLAGLACCMAVGLVGCQAEPYQPSPDSSEPYVHTHTFDDACDSSCNGCGYERNVVHSYTMLKYGKTEHWYECRCGAINEGTREVHEGGEATCTKQAVCDICAKSYGDPLPHRSSGVVPGQAEEVCLDCGHIISPAALRTLVFYTDGGKDIPCLISTQQDLEEITLPAAEKYGYDFENWYFDKEYEKPFVAEEIATSLVELYAKYIPKEYTVQVQFSHENSCTISGELTQTVSVEAPFSAIRITPDLGYVFEYYEIDGICYQSNVVQVPFADKDLTVNVVVDYATYELPIVNLHTEGEVGVSEDTAMQFSIENCEGELEDISGGIRLRENFTGGFSKQSYSFEFDQKQSLFGLDSAKGWALFAEYLNPTGLRNYVALTLGNQTDGLRFTPSPHKVNVYRNGEFLGLYTLCEQIDESKGRLDMEMEIQNGGFISDAAYIDLTDYNFFLTMDDTVVNSSGAEEGVTYFEVSNSPRKFKINYPTVENFITIERFDSYVSQLRSYMENVIRVLQTGSFADVQEIINVESLVDYYIIDNIMLEQDHKWKSFNMYYISENSSKGTPQERGKLNFGPIWDYDMTINDWAEGRPNTDWDYTEGNVTVDGIYSFNIFFDTIARFYELEDMVKERYNTIFKKALGDFIDGYEVLTYRLEESYALNNQKWYSVYTYDITVENITYLYGYFCARKAFLDEAWKITTGA